MGEFLAAVCVQWLGVLVLRAAAALVLKAGAIQAVVGDALREARTAVRNSSRLAPRTASSSPIFSAWPVPTGSNGGLVSRVVIV